MSDNTLIAVVMTVFFTFLAILAISTESPAKLAEKDHCKIDHHEYQIELEFDTVLIYDDNRFVGRYIVTNPLSPIDSILADDNR